MGEKRAYKPRKPGGGRKKLKPDYDAGKNLKEQMESAVALYNSEMSLQAIGDALNLNPIKVRKLLITAGVYESDVAEKVKNTFEKYRETQDYNGESFFGYQNSGFVCEWDDGKKEETTKDNSAIHKKVQNLLINSNYSSYPLLEYDDILEAWVYVNTTENIC